MLFEEFVPHFDILKRVLSSNIVDKDSALGIFQICWDQASVSLLSSCIPHLQSVNLPASRHISHIEINSNSWLRKGTGTLCDYSYLLVVYRSMMELFPTPWSPRKTILSLIEFLLVFDEVILILSERQQSFDHHSFILLNLNLPNKHKSQNYLLKKLWNSLTINHYMSQCIFTCVNCQLQFGAQLEYKEHYKSEHHRYNVKRKLIGLVPLSFNDYILQFQTELSSKSQSQSEIYCEVCSKKFMSPQTYKQHINSQKHKSNRKLLLNNTKKDKSETSSISEFEVIGGENEKQVCFFCFSCKSQKHLETHHCFPPFKSECTNLEGLIHFVEETIKQGHCIYCDLTFTTEDSVKQHMSDLGHNKLNIDNFGPFEQFYLWKINESSSEDEEEELTQQIQVLQQDGESEFSVLHHTTLQDLEERRLNRIKYTTTGVIINGKQVGYRAYKKYYKQYLSRNVQSAPREHQKALGFSETWNQSLKYLKPKPQYDVIVSNRNHR